MFSAFNWLYSKIIDKRNAQYETGFFESHKLTVPTISVGNITVGGTGKTPLVIYIAQILAEKGGKVCVISRGYKRENEKERVLVSDGHKILSSPRKSGDELYEMAKKLLGKAIIIADADRVAAGAWAIQEFGVTACILDDAFQHLKIKRDLDIVAIDATNPFGNRKTLPTGILREPLKNLQRSDLIIITRGNLVENLDNLKTEIQNLHPKCRILIADNQISQITKLKEFSNESLTKKNSKLVFPKSNVLAFCALGNPNNFFNQLTTEGINVTATKTFRDHYQYDQKDVSAIEKEALASNCKLLFTTAKDAVKLRGLKFSLPIYVIESRIILDNEKKLRDIIYAVFDT